MRRGGGWMRRGVGWTWISVHQNRLGSVCIRIEGLIERRRVHSAKSVREVDAGRDRATPRGGGGTIKSRRQKETS
jgi:hypothetical protein